MREKQQSRYIEQIQAFAPCCEQEERDKELILDLCSGANDILTRKNRVFHFTSSGLILNEARDKILMVHHNIYKTWTWTGGHTDGEADLEAVALREAGEETGVSRVRMILDHMASLDILPVYGHIKNGAYVSAHLHLNAAYLLCAFDTDKLTVQEQENSAVAWVTLDEIAQHSGEQEILYIYRKMFTRLGIAFPG